MPIVNLDNSKAIIIFAKNFQGDVEVLYGPVSHLEYEDLEVDIKTSWNSDKTIATVNINYEKGDFLSKFFSFSKNFHQIPIKLFVNEEVKSLKLDLSSADLNIDLDSTEIEELVIKTYSGDFDVSGAPNSHMLNFFEIDSKSGDAEIDLNDTTVEEFILKSASGDFDIYNTNIYNCTFSFASGDLTIDNSEIQDLNLNMASGDVSVENSLITNAKINAASGDIFIDSLTDNFYCRIDAASADVNLYVQGKESIYLEGAIKKLASSVKSNVDLIQTYEKSNFDKKRVLKINILSGDVTIKGKEIEYLAENTLKKDQTKEKSFSSDDFLTVEEKKILNLLKEEKISRTFAKELLKELGYSEEDSENFLKNRGV